MRVFFVLLLHLILCCQSANTKPIPKNVPPDVIVYRAKKVITMDPAIRNVDAVAVRGTRIVAAGSERQVRDALGATPFRYDDTFRSHYILPGFIDQHLHPFLGALSLAMEVISTEDWPLPSKTYKAANNGEEYITALEAAVGRDPNDTSWFFSWGYHPLWHGELSRQILDEVSEKRPIAIWHRSCHEFYFNSAAMKALGLKEETMKNKGEASTMLDFAKGHFWESGMNLIMVPLLKVLASPERMERGLKQMVTYLHQKGVTAFNEPGALYTPEIWKMYQQILGAPETPFYSYFIVDGRTQVDTGISLAQSMDDTRRQIAIAPEGKVSFFDKQIKFFADGAIISQLMQMNNGYTDGHQGVWLIQPDILEERVKLYWNAGFQLHIHVNGDLGLETVLGILERRMAEHPRANHRTVIIHFSNSTEEQIARIARLGAIVSANPYYPVGFANKFAQGLGTERANLMVRSRSVLKNNIPLSFHSDLPMAPSDPLYLVWSAVNRLTPSGEVVGKDQRITVEEALRAITIEAAYSWQKEHELGKIAPGYVANFTILERNPLTEPSRTIKDIPIWGTVFEGRHFPLSSKQTSLSRPALGEDWYDSPCTTTGKRHIICNPMMM